MEINEFQELKKLLIGQKYVEIVYLKSNQCKEFMEAMSKIAKFYVSTGNQESELKIFLKFNNDKEGHYRYFQALKHNRFMESYGLKK